MRVIKFRAWDNSTKKMYYNSGLTVHNNNIIHMDGEIMQFTGLLDKNGKEIYEGDVIQYFDKIVAVVVWQDYGGWSYKWIDPTYIKIRQRNPEPFFHNISLAEAIGNIYETPELLSQ